MNRKNFLLAALLTPLTALVKPLLAQRPQSPLHYPFSLGPYGVPTWMGDSTQRWRVLDYLRSTVDLPEGWCWLEYECFDQRRGVWETGVRRADGKEMTVSIPYKGLHKIEDAEKWLPSWLGWKQ